MAIRRAKVASRLGVSITTVKKLHGSLLHPQKDAEGAFVYSPEEVAKAAAIYVKQNRRRTVAKKIDAMGAKAAEAFELFDQGESLAGIVKQLRVRPGVVRQWYRDWKYGFEGKSGAEDELASANAEAAAFAIPPTPTSPAADADHDEKITSTLRAIIGGKS